MKPTSELSVKNMVCNRCIRVVREELQNLGYQVNHISLGKVSLQGNLSDQDISRIRETLAGNGFELLEDQQQQLIEKVKTLIIDHIHHHHQKPEYQNFSDYLTQKTGINYFHLSKLFSSMEGVTIEKYIILQKVEKVKELLIYGEQSLADIAFDLEYSSVAHLSGQFKKVTGLSPSAFRKLVEPRRNSLDQINPPKS